MTEGVTDVGEGLGQKALSGVGAVESFVEAGVQGALSGVAQQRLQPPAEVDTESEVDISGTVLRLLNRAIEVEQLRVTCNAESQLNTCLGEGRSICFNFYSVCVQKGYNVNIQK